LAIPVGVVVSGYVKNMLLARACKRKNLIQWDAKTVRATIGFSIWSGVLGTALWFAPIDGIISLCVAIAVFGILYLPVAYIMDRKL
jgi:CHASE2 domain-containing sensor protein